MRSQSSSFNRSEVNALPVFRMRVTRRTLWTLYMGNLLTSIGLWFFLPLLSIFLGRKGGSAALVGVVTRLRRAADLGVEPGHARDRERGNSDFGCVGGRSSIHAR